MGKIYLEGADNTRDLGGLKTTEGAVIKDKQLIRQRTVYQGLRRKIRFYWKQNIIYRKFWI